MDIRSAIDKADQFENDNHVPEFKPRPDHSMKQSTIVDHSEYKDIVTELIDWKRFINFIERGNTTQLGILITDTKIRLS